MTWHGKFYPPMAMATTNGVQELIEPRLAHVLLLSRKSLPKQTLKFSCKFVQVRLE